MAEPSPLMRYVALGDSTAVGVGSTKGGYPEFIFQALKAAGFPVGILNLGQSGATTARVVDSQIPRLRGKRLDLVTLGIGTNDLWRMVSEREIATNLQRIADAVESTGAEVLVSNVSDLSLSPMGKQMGTMLGIPSGAFAARLQAINEAIADLAKRPRFTLIDVCTFSRQELPLRTDMFCTDGFHPSEAGYRRWAELLIPKALDLAASWRQAHVPREDAAG